MRVWRAFHTWRLCSTGQPSANASLCRLPQRRYVLAHALACRHRGATLGPSPQYPLDREKRPAPRDHNPHRYLRTDRQSRHHRAANRYQGSSLMPRERPWFIQAKQSRTSWCKPHPISRIDTQEINLSFAKPMQNGAGVIGVEPESAIHRALAQICHDHPKYATGHRQ